MARKVGQIILLLHRRLARVLKVKDGEGWENATPLVEWERGLGI